MMDNVYAIPESNPFIPIIMVLSVLTLICAFFIWAIHDINRSLNNE